MENWNDLTFTCTAWDFQSAPSIVISFKQPEDESPFPYQKEADWIETTHASSLKIVRLYMYTYLLKICIEMNYACIV